MDTVPPPATTSSRRRAGSLLALALAAATSLSVLSPATAAPSAPSAPLVEVVVSSTSAGVAAAADAVRAAGGVVRDALPLTGGVSASLPSDAVLAPSFSVVQNAPLSLASRKVASTGASREATAVREALGLGAPDGEGAGLTIAVVDTGIQDSAEFAGRLTHVDVSGSWDEGESRDGYGHGTFVAGIAAGGGDEDPRYAGVAPGADVLDIRVADESGATDLVTVLRGLEAAAAGGADVVNLSMSSGSPLPYHVDPLSIALGRLWAAGVVVVVPTGNDGPKPTSITSPGTDPTLLTVGALDEKLTAEDRDDDVVAPFSGRGPAPQGVLKPDLVAPGTSVVSVRAHGSEIDTENASARVGASYFRGSGTSFATAAMAGAAATLLQHRPELSPEQVKSLVRSTAYQGRSLGDRHSGGAGGLDLQAALAAEAPAVEAPVFDAPPAGDDRAWRAFLQGLMDDDRAAADAAWKQISPEGHRWGGHRWGGHRWGGHRWGGHRWGANGWSGHRWASSDVSADEWEMRVWAGHRWAGHRWGSDAFVGHRWGASTWSGHRWGASTWSGHRWGTSTWSGHRWGASSWVASRWA
jgi:serine protease AprX